MARPKTRPAILQQKEGGGERGEVNNGTPTLQVSLKPSLTCDEAQAMSFEAGSIRKCIEEWKCISSDLNILQAVKGCKIEWINNKSPYQIKAPKEGKFSYTEQNFINIEISRLLQKSVIIPCDSEQGEFISTIFVRPKVDGSYRLILNLKMLNKSIVYHHFKMDNLQSAINMMTKNCYLASVDLKDAYYSVPIHVDYQKYLKFSWQGQLYKFTCLPNGLACAPRIFTKLLKPMFSSLRSKGYLSVSYIDDCYLQGNTFQECVANIEATVKLFDKLGFMIHQGKSVLQPSHEITFLGFTLNSDKMLVSLTPKKADSIKKSIKDLLSKNRPTIRELAEVIGKLVAAFPGCLYGPLHYRKMENNKSVALKESHGNYDSIVTITAATKKELLWWTDNITRATKPINHPKPDIVIKSDASLKGWGAFYDNESTGGRWSEMECKQHINVLELKAAFFALKAFCHKFKNKHIQIFIDNTTAVAYVNNMGGSHSMICDDIAKEIWLWCIERDIWLSAVHLPGSVNVEADKASRVFDDNTEWQLRPDLFQLIIDKLITPEIDLFASRLNNQIARYVSWHPDPGAVAVDAFSVDWSTEIIYAFPPFSLIGKVLQKFVNDKAEGILIVPNWPTQTWFPQMMQLLVTEPLTLPKGKTMLTLPFKKELVHPLYPKLQLLACHLSARHH